MYVAGIRAETLQLLLDLYPGGIHVIDGNGRLLLHQVCQSHFLMLQIISLLVEAAPSTVIEKSTRGCMPDQLAWSSCNRDIEVEAYLLEWQNKVANTMKETLWMLPICSWVYQFL
jgi:hypothetical protein